MTDDPRCATCAFWRGYTVGADHGDCKYLRAGTFDNHYIEVSGVDNLMVDQHEEPFSTHRDFGCVHHLSRGDE